WHVDVADAGVLDGVHDGIDECGRTADGGTLPDALGADRVVGAWCHHLVQFEAGRLPRRRQQVVHVVGADAIAVGVEGDELHAGHGEGLGQPTHDLSFHDHRVDPHAAVVDGHHVEDVPDAGLRVDLDRGDVAGERPRQVGRVVVRVVLEAGLHAVGHVAV